MFRCRGFFDSEKRVFVDTFVEDVRAFEYLTEINGWFAQMLIGLNGYLDEDSSVTPEALISYFPGIDRVLDDRIWNAKSWEFTERYVPYLKFVDKYLVD